MVLTSQTYPRDFVPRNNLGLIYDNLGQHDQSLAELREAVRLDPSGLTYANLMTSYLQLNRLEEARATAEEAQEKKVDSPSLHFFLYQLAFLHNDMAGMAKEVAWSAGKAGVEDVLLANEADTAAYYGRLDKARDFSRQAAASAKRAEEKETASNYEADAALREALFGNANEARQRAAAAEFQKILDHRGIVVNSPIGALARLGLARAHAMQGDTAKAKTAYQDFLTLWKDADSDIPILKQAKAEYAKLN